MPSLLTLTRHVFHLAGRLEREAGLESGAAIAKAIGQAFTTVVIGIYFTVMGGLVTLTLPLTPNPNPNP